ncbi:hypothetical protein ACFL3Q_12370 [Planctomycetota bacterium]
MAYPTFDQRQKYRSIQSSALGSISIQGGYVFDEGGNLLGQAPEWGSGLFMKKGQPTDPYQTVKGYALKHPYDGPPKEDPSHAAQPPPQPVKAALPTDEIDAAFSGGIVEEAKPMPVGDLDGTGHGSGTV